MDLFELKIVDSWSPVAPGDCAEFIINGRRLIEIINEVEAEQSQHSSYMGIPAEIALLPSKHLLGEPDPDDQLYQLEDGRTPVLRCCCGVLACDPVYVRIMVGESTITWSDFRNPWHTEEYQDTPVDYSRLKFVFDKKQYLDQLSRKG